MDLSAERLVKSALAQVVISRSVVIGLATVGNGIKTVGHGFTVIGAGVEMLANAAFTIEADGARKYESLTGADLGQTIGFPGRYLGVHGSVPMPEPEEQQP